eukprot:195387-Amorphochlora_amoeboformis.AAC.1
MATGCCTAKITESLREDTSSSLTIDSRNAGFFRHPRRRGERRGGGGERGSWRRKRVKRAKRA